MFKKDDNVPAKTTRIHEIDPADIDSAFVAALFGITRHRVSQLYSEGVIRNNGIRGRYALIDVTRAYLDYLKDSKRGGTKERLARQQERKLKIQNDRLAQTLIDIDEAADAFRIACRLWRAGAEAVPKNVAARIAKAKHPKDIRDILTGALNELVPVYTKPLDELCRDGTA